MCICLALTALDLRCKIRISTRLCQLAINDIKKEKTQNCKLEQRMMSIVNSNILVKKRDRKRTNCAKQQI